MRPDAHEFDGGSSRFPAGNTRHRGANRHVCKGIVHVAGPTFDVIGAMNAGMQGAWLTRDENVWESFAGVQPDATINMFYDLAYVLDVWTPVRRESGSQVDSGTKLYWLVVSDICD